MSDNPKFRSVDQVLIWANGDRKAIEKELEQLDNAETKQWQYVTQGVFPYTKLIRPQWYDIGPYRKRIRARWNELWDIRYQQLHVKAALHRYDHPLRLNRVINGTRFVKLYGGRTDKAIVQIPLTQNNLRIPIIPKLEVRMYKEGDTIAYPLEIDFEEYELKIWFDGVMRTYEERMVLR